MPLSKEEILLDELLHTAKLHSKHRGELAELAFMHRAASLGFAVAKPWGESDSYDVVVRSGKIFWRVQVKSVLAKAPGHKEYRVKAVNSLHIAYTAEQIDFLAAYIFAEDIWYILPATLVEKHFNLALYPGSTRSRYEQYREAWKLMESPAAEPVVQPVLEAAVDVVLAT